MILCAVPIFKLYSHCFHHATAILSIVDGIYVPQPLILAQLYNLFWQIEDSQQDGKQEQTPVCLSSLASSPF